MATMEDAKRAVDAMNKKEVDGRQINVELAKPRTEGPRPPRSNNPDSRPPTGTRGGRGSGRGGRGRGRGGRGRGSRGRGRGGRGGRIDPSVPRTESKTVLFVSNLPFEMDDAGFAKIFTDHKFNVKKAFVIVRHYGRQTRSRGYGFVEFETEDTQKKALEALNGAEINGRKLNVKIAFDEMHERPQVQSPAQPQAQHPAQPQVQHPAQHPAQPQAQHPAPQVQQPAPQAQQPAPQVQQPAQSNPPAAQKTETPKDSPNQPKQEKKAPAKKPAAKK